jgi:hypothetical protein
MRIFCNFVMVFPAVGDRRKGAFYGRVVCMADGVKVLGTVFGDVR